MSWRKTAQRKAEPAVFQLNYTQIVGKRAGNLVAKRKADSAAVRCAAQLFVYLFGCGGQLAVHGQAGNKLKQRPYGVFALLRRGGMSRNALACNGNRVLLHGIGNAV